MGTIPLRDDEHGTAVTTDIGVFYMESLRNFIYGIQNKLFAQDEKLAPKAGKARWGLTSSAVRDASVRICLISLNV
jgi:hypothetical protein